MVMLEYAPDHPSRSLVFTPQTEIGSAEILTTASASMFDSLLFEVFYHMLVPGSDNIFIVMHGQWGVAFRVDCDTSCNSRWRRFGQKPKG
jgi:hypothetical protein